MLDCTENITALEKNHAKTKKCILQLKSLWFNRNKSSCRWSANVGKDWESLKRQQRLTFCFCYGLCGAKNSGKSCYEQNWKTNTKSVSRLEHASTFFSHSVPSIDGYFIGWTIAILFFSTASKPHAIRQSNLFCYISLRPKYLEHWTQLWLNWFAVSRESLWVHIWIVFCYIPESQRFNTINIVPECMQTKNIPIQHVWGVD